MEKIRQGIFETNSSSIHSFTLGDEKLIALEKIGGDVEVFPGQFGWGPDRYRDMLSKASYLLTWCWSDHHTYQKKPSFVLKPEECLSVLKEVLLEVYDKVDFTESTDPYYPKGYIDHQSIEWDGGTGAEIFASRETVREFLFNPKSILEIDNDNH